MIRFAFLYVLSKLRSSPNYIAKGIAIVKTMPSPQKRGRKNTSLFLSSNARLETASGLNVSYVEDGLDQAIKFEEEGNLKMK